MDYLSAFVTPSILLPSRKNTAGFECLRTRLRSRNSLALSLSMSSPPLTSTQSNPTKNTPANTGALPRTTKRPQQKIQKRIPRSKPSKDNTVDPQVEENNIVPLRAHTEVVEKKKEVPKRKLDDVTVSEKLVGTVRNLVPHGAYVDIGAERDGLVHLRDMSVDFVHFPSDILRDGDKVTVWIKYVNPKNRVLGLTMIKPHFGFGARGKVADLTVDSRCIGVVERITNYGAYVDISAERFGFLHVAGIWSLRPRDILENLKIGQKIWVQIADIDVPRSHIRLWARAKKSKQLTEHNEVEFTQIRHLEEEEEEVTGFNPTTRSWNETDEGSETAETEEEANGKDDSVEDEYAFAKDTSAIQDKLLMGKDITPDRIEELEEIAHMFDEKTEFINN